MRPRRILAVAGLLILSMVLLASASNAVTVEDVAVADEAAVGGQNLVLNGVGVREATMLKVKVYVMGLYLPEKTQDAEAIIASEGNKRIAMHFVRSVGVEDLRKGWTEGFEKNTQDVAAVQSEIDRFNATMRDVEEGEAIVLDFIDQSVAVSVGGQQADTIEGRDFQQALVAIWLGPHPPNDSLKSGVLGGSP